VWRRELKIHRRSNFLFDAKSTPEEKAPELNLLADEWQADKKRAGRLLRNAPLSGKAIRL
jgi:hypothetical protein